MTEPSRRAVLDRVRREFSDETDGFELDAVRNAHHRDLWHVWPHLDGLSPVGGAVYIVHTPTSRVFQVPGSRPPEENVAEVLRQVL